MRVKKSILIVMTLFNAAFLCAQISADIRGRGCGGGRGMCSVSDEGSEVGNVFLEYDSDTAELKIKFILSELTTEEQYSLFGELITSSTDWNSVYYIQEEDLILSTGISSNLGYTSGGIKIETGVYGVEKADTLAIIRIDLN